MMCRDWYMFFNTLSVHIVLPLKSLTGLTPAWALVSAMLTNLF